MPIRSHSSSEDRNSLFSRSEDRATAPKKAAEGNSKGAEWISAHCDGGARGNPGPAGYGALIQAADGSIVAELSEFLGFKTNNFAEYSGLLGCLQYAIDHGHRRLKLVSDSELMVKQIQGKYQVKSPDLKPLYDEAKRRIAQLEGFEISHALRHKNKDADRLANEAMDRGMKRPASAAPAVARAVPYPARPEAREVASQAPGTSASGKAAAGIPAAAAPPIAIAHRERPLPGAGRADGPGAESMLRGFTRDGVIHVLGSERLPDGIFVKIIRE